MLPCGRGVGTRQLHHEIIATALNASNCEGGVFLCVPALSMNLAARMNINTRNDQLREFTGRLEDRFMVDNVCFCVR